MSSSSLLSRLVLTLTLTFLAAPLPLGAQAAPPSIPPAATPSSIPASSAPMTAAPAPAPAPPLPRCAEDGDGAACAWGWAEGFDAGGVQVHGLPIALIGIQVPGHKDLCASRSRREEFDCSRPARKRMGELLRNGVACELLDVAAGQLWGRCRTSEGDLGRLLVLAGVARAAKDGPYEDSQLQAITSRRGLWSPDIVPPRDWESVRRKATDRD